MISKAYDKADFEFIEFSLEDVLTNSAVVTTAPPTTIPGTTSSGGVNIGGGGEITIPWSDFFQ